MGGAVGAGAEDHLSPGPDLLDLPVALDLDADGALALEEDLAGQRVGDDGEVGALHRRVEVGDGGAAPHAAPLGGLEASDAELRGAVEVLVVRQSGLDGRVDPGVDDGVHRSALVDRERAAGAVELVRAAHVVLGAREVGQDVLVVPALGAVGGPPVVVGAVAAHVDHRVDRTAATEDLAAGEEGPAAVDPRLGLGVVVPVERALEEAGEGCRDVDLVHRVRGAALDEGDRDLGVLAQPGGQGATGRAGTDDDVVEQVLSQSPLMASSCPPSIASARDDALGTRAQRSRPLLWGGHSAQGLGLA